jgi:hypothetical protein
MHGIRDFRQSRDFTSRTINDSIIRTRIKNPARAAKRLQNPEPIRMPQLEE